MGEARLGYPKNKERVPGPLLPLESGEPPPLDVWVHRVRRFRLLPME